QTTKRVAMPEGVWYDYFHGTGCSCGPSSATDYEVNASSWTDFPLFVREGAIIPTQAVQNYLDERTVKELTIDIFPSDKLTSFSLYDDDGETYNYEKGDFFKQNISAIRKGESASVTLARPNGHYRTTWKQYVLRVHSGGSNTAAKES